MSRPIRKLSKFIWGAEMLTVENIDLYYGASQALKSVSLTAEPGKVTTVLGRNGVGKTSLTRAIVGRNGISAGSIKWDGEEISQSSPPVRALSGIASVPQGREVFPLLTVKENLETGYACLPRGEKSIPDEVFDLFPVLKEMLSRRGGDLSGGQQQQLAIGRAMVTQPKLLVLDEPTEGIQPSIIKDIGRAIEFLRENGDMAIVLVEQYFEFARDLADEYVVMDRGEIVLSGSAADMDEGKVQGLLTV